MTAVTDQDHDPAHLTEGAGRTGPPRPGCEPTTGAAAVGAGSPGDEGASPGGEASSGEGAGSGRTLPRTGVAGRRRVRRARRTRGAMASVTAGAMVRMLVTPVTRSPGTRPQG